MLNIGSIILQVKFIGITKALSIIAHSHILGFLDNISNNICEYMYKIIKIFVKRFQKRVYKIC